MSKPMKFAVCFFTDGNENRAEKLTQQAHIEYLYDFQKKGMQQLKHWLYAMQCPDEFSEEDCRLIVKRTSADLALLGISTDIIMF